MKKVGYGLLLLCLIILFVSTGCEEKGDSKSDSYFAYFKQFPGGIYTEYKTLETFPSYLRGKGTEYIESHEDIEKTKSITIQNKIYEVGYQCTYQNAIRADTVYRYESESISTTFRYDGKLQSCYIKEAVSAPYNVTDKESEYRLLLEAKEIIRQLSGISVEEYEVEIDHKQVGHYPRDTRAYYFTKMVNEVRTEDRVMVLLRGDALLIEYNAFAGFGLVPDDADYRFDSDLVYKAIEAHATDAFAQSREAFGAMQVLREPNPYIGLLADGTPYLVVDVMIRFENESSAYVATEYCIFQEELSPEYFAPKTDPDDYQHS